VQATTVWPKITVTADGQGVASHAGTRLLGDLADAVGMSAAFSDALAGLRERRSCHDPGRVLVDVAVMLADGGEAISDLAVLRDQPGLFGSVASTATAWRSWTRSTTRCLIGCVRLGRPRGWGPGCCAPRPAAARRRRVRVVGTGLGWFSTWTPQPGSPIAPQRNSERGWLSLPWLSRRVAPQEQGIAADTGTPPRSGCLPVLDHRDCW
jgi:hypothetical protein